jgi:hypothetical protein
MRALNTLGISVGLGLAANILLRDVRWGLGFPVFVVIAAMTGWRLWKSSSQPMSKAAAWMAVPMIVFSACLAWRDSDTLRAMNLFAFFLALGILVSRVRVGGLGKLSFAELAIGWLAHYAAAIFEFGMLVFKDVPWRSFGSPSARLRAQAAFRGILIAVPILIVFGSLLASADAVFSSTMGRLFDWNPVQFWQNLFGTLLGSWVVGSIFRRVFLEPEPVTSAEFWNASLGSSMPPPPYAKGLQPVAYQLTDARPAAPKIPTQPGIGNGEASIALGALILLLGAFAAIQVRFLFGGSFALPQGITYSQYARSGFFELLAVTCLAVPVLRLVQYGLKRRGANGWTYPTLAGIVVGLLGIVVASAFRRLALYVDTYGLSELRLYGGAAMAWISVCLGWLLVTLYARRHQAFVIGAVIAGFGAILGLNALNPDSLIARVNLDRAMHGKGLDAAYLARLSGDAVPAIVNRMNALPADQRNSLKAGVLDTASGASSGDWRAWNWGAAEAGKVIGMAGP